MFSQCLASKFRFIRMKRACSLLLLCSLPAIALTVNTSCVRLSRHRHVSDLTPPAPTAPLINLNTATRRELESLPGIGAGIAARIIEHRERHGAFRRIEHLLMVRGISARRFEELRPMVCVN